MVTNERPHRSSAKKPNPAAGCAVPPASPVTATEERRFARPQEGVGGVPPGANGVRLRGGVRVAERGNDFLAAPGASTDLAREVGGAVVDCAVAVGEQIEAWATARYHGEAPASCHGVRQGWRRRDGRRFSFVEGGGSLSVVPELGSTMLDSTGKKARSAAPRSMASASANAPQETPPARGPPQRTRLELRSTGAPALAAWPHPGSSSTQPGRRHLAGDAWAGRRCGGASRGRAAARRVARRRRHAGSEATAACREARRRRRRVGMPGGAASLVRERQPEKQERRNEREAQQRHEREAAAATMASGGMKKEISETHDAFRFGINAGVKADLAPPHPLQSTIQSEAKFWADKKKFGTEAIYGSAFNIRKDLDAQILSRFQRPPGALPSSMLGYEALTGSLDDFGFEDYLNMPQDSDSFRQPDMHHGMEVHLGLSKGPICPSFN